MKGLEPKDITAQLTSKGESNRTVGDSIGVNRQLVHECVKRKYGKFTPKAIPIKTRIAELLSEEDEHLEFKEILNHRKKTYHNLFPEIKFYFSPIPNEFTKIRFSKNL